MYLILFIIVGLVGGYGFHRARTHAALIRELSAADRGFLQSHVLFYSHLEELDKRRFEKDIVRFLNTTTITGVRTDVTMEDKLLVASSAAIPIFGFPGWEYNYLDQVLLYPGPFDRHYSIDEPEELITGMVGSGHMEGIMILSKPALHAGFEVDNDRRNVGVHEFVHLFDKEDGRIDGLPDAFTADGFTAPWVELIREKTRDIQRDRSDIDSYGATAPQEFFAVAAEYFFERPHLLASRHPALYATLAEVFRQDPKRYFPRNRRHRREIGKNSPCPCGSGEKFKRCCMART